MSQVMYASNFILVILGYSLLNSLMAFLIKHNPDRYYGKY